MDPVHLAAAVAAGLLMRDFVRWAVARFVKDFGDD